MLNARFSLLDNAIAVRSVQYQAFRNVKTLGNDIAVNVALRVDPSWRRLALVRCSLPFQ
jgi:hypothetical protein